MDSSSSEITQTKAPPRRLLSSRGRSFLRRCSDAFLWAGLLALGYCGFVWAGASVYQAYQSWRFDRLTKSARRAASSPGSLIGRLEVPRIRLSAMVLEGDDSGTLRVAVGHIPGTALPAQSGNIGIAGHRDTFFRGLRKVRKNDVIRLSTPAGSYAYRVESVGVVGPTNTEVLEASARPTLTLVTCYPFYFVGSAPDRFIVRAKQVASRPHVSSVKLASSKEIEERLATPLLY